MGVEEVKEVLRDPFGEGKRGGGGGGKDGELGLQRSLRETEKMGPWLRVKQQMRVPSMTRNS